MVNLTILAIHDDPGFEETLNRAVSNAAYQCQSVSNGPDALEILEIQRPGLIILDADLPFRSNSWVLKEVRRRRPNLPVILITRPEMDEIKREALEQGASIYLEKPVREDTLRRMVARILREA